MVVGSTTPHPSLRPRHGATDSQLCKHACRVGSFERLRALLESQGRDAPERQRLCTVRTWRHSSCVCTDRLVPPASVCAPGLCTAAVRHTTTVDLALDRK
jgi:hypothetical protein